MSKGTILCRALLMSLVCGCKSFGKESNVKNRQHLSPENITAFAIKAEIPVKSKPNRTAKTLDLWRVNLVAKVLNLNMPDDEGDSAPPWIEIQYQSMGKTILGFVSTEESTRSRNLLIFKAPEPEHRPISDGNRHVLADTIPNGIANAHFECYVSALVGSEVSTHIRQNEIVELLEIGAFMNSDFEDQIAWYRVKTDAGAICYTPSFNIISGSSHLLRELSRLNYRVNFGFGVAKSGKAELFTMLDENEETINLRPHRKKDTTQTETVSAVAIYGEFTLKGEAYYFVDQKASSVAAPSKYYAYEEVFAVRKADFDAYSNYLAFSRKFPHSLPNDKIDFLNQSAGGNLNLQCSQYKEINPGAGGQIFSVLIIRRGFLLRDGELVKSQRDCIHEESIFEPISVFYRNSKAGLIEVGRISGGKLSYVDLDGDRIPEIIHDSFGFGISRFLALYRIQNDAVSEFARFRTYADIECPEAHLANSFIVIDFPHYAGEESVRKPKNYSQLDMDCKYHMDEDFSGFKKTEIRKFTFPTFVRWDGTKFRIVKKPKNFQREMVRARANYKPAPAQSK